MLIIGVLLVTLLGVRYLNHTPGKDTDRISKNINAVPVFFAQWRGTDIGLEESVYQILETRSIIHRKYNSDKSFVFLSIVYYSETKVDFHAPEACLAGKGIEISKTKHKVVLQTESGSKQLIVNQLIRETDRGQEVIHYFYKAGDFLRDNYIKLRLNLALNKFTKAKKSGALIRYSTPVKSGDSAAADKILTQFINDLYPFLLKYL